MVVFDEDAIRDGITVLGSYVRAAAECIPQQEMIPGRVSGEPMGADNKKPHDFHRAASVSG